MRNASMILHDGELHGGLAIRDGRILDIFSASESTGQGVDLEGDFLIPGLTDLHTDNLEKHFTPRAGVSWPGVAAGKIISHPRREQA